jgi:hypothetical protein
LGHLRQGAVDYVAVLWRNDHAAARDARHSAAFLYSTPLATCHSDAGA